MYLPPERRSEDMHNKEILVALKKELDGMKDTQDNIQDKLNQIWDTVFGVHEAGLEYPGLRQQMEVILPVIRVVRAGIVAIKWFTITLLGAIIVGIVNLLVLATP